MAPRKRKAEGGEKEAVPSKTETTTSVRVTRSASRLAGGMSSASELAKAKSTVKKAKATKKTKKKKKEDEEVKAEVETCELEQTTEASESKTKTVVIEHCKQCNSFKTRANMVKNGLEKAVPHVTVLLNPEKPRKGCFEIREEGGEMFISLLDMKRPFQPMKDLDMDQVISDIVDKLK